MILSAVTINLRRSFDLLGPRRKPTPLGCEGFGPFTKAAAHHDPGGISRMVDPFLVSETDIYPH